MDTAKVFCQLSEPQKTIWNHEKAYPGSSLGIVAGNLRLQGKLDYSALEKAVNIFIKTNDSMRLRIVETNGVVLQYVADYEPIRLDFIDFSSGGGLKDLFLWDEGTTRKPLDIIDCPLFYCALYKIGDTEGGAYMKIHRLISDSWSLGLMAKRMISLYRKIRRGEWVDESPGASYMKFLRSEAAYRKSSRFEYDRDYWNRKFEKIAMPAVLKPINTAITSMNAKRKILIAPLKLTEKARDFCRTNKLSVCALFMSALSIYINRVTGLEDILLGSTILNRTGAEERATIGRFANAAMPIRITVNDMMDFRMFAKTMMKEYMEVLKHQKYPAAFIYRELKKKNPSMEKLCDIVLGYQSPRYFENITDDEYVTKWIFPGCQTESLFINVDDRDSNGSINIHYGFRTDIFDLREIECMHQHLINLLWHALDNPLRKISKLEMISEKEKHTILHDFNHTFVDYPGEKTIHQIFEEQAARTPEKTALIFEDKRLTYSELNRKANNLARVLRTAGIGPDKLVAVMARHSFELIIGIIGVLKAGGAYLPIDPDDLAERRNAILKTSCASILLIQNDLRDTVSFAGTLINLNDDEAGADDTVNQPSINGPRDLACVLYGEGTPYRLMGVMIEHSGILSRISWMQHKCPLHEGDVVLLNSACADATFLLLLSWWMRSGGTCCLQNPRDGKKPDIMCQTIKEMGIAAMFISPSLLGQFLHEVSKEKDASKFSSLKYVFASDGVPGTDQVRLFNDLLYRHNGTQLTILYGPAEATVVASSFDCTPIPPLSSIPIGRPIDNTNMYIFDRKQNLLPVGIPGELYIGGSGVARGYLYNPERTAERFIINPYKRNEILYRTGDRARWYPRGDVEYLGRIDDRTTH